MALAKIVYASLTGNTEEIADIVAEALEDLDIEVEVEECTQVDATDFLTADLCIVATYTYDGGHLPDEIYDFYQDLKEVNLSDKVFGVVGSGDTFYEEYCYSVDDFVKVFLTTGATQGAASVKVDLGAEEEDIQNLEKFAAEMVATLTA